MIKSSKQRTIIGIDPGYGRIGVGVIQQERSVLRCISYTCIMPPKGAFPDRLEYIYVSLTDIFKNYLPAIVSVEKLYFHKNTTTALDVSQARGVILLTAKLLHMPICEFTPLQVKLSVAGYGRADKLQVQKMVKLLLSLSSIPKPDDAADALALAICASTHTKNL